MVHRVSDHSGRPETGHDRHLDLALDQLLSHSPVPDQVLDRNDRHPELGGDLTQLGGVGHAVPVLREDFDQAADRATAGHADQVDGCFGVPGPPQDAAGLGQQRVGVSPADEVLGTAAGLGNRADRHRAVGGTDTRAGADVIDGGQEVGAGLGAGAERVARW